MHGAWLGQSTRVRGLTQSSVLDMRTYSTPEPRAVSSRCTNAESTSPTTRVSSWITKSSGVGRRGAARALSCRAQRMLFAWCSHSSATSTSTSAGSAARARRTFEAYRVRMLAVTPGLPRSPSKMTTAREPLRPHASLTERSESRMSRTFSSPSSRGRAALLMRIVVSAATPAGGSSRAAPGRNQASAGRPPQPVRFLLQHTPTPAHRHGVQLSCERGWTGFSPRAGIAEKLGNFWRRPGRHFRETPRSRSHTTPQIS